MARPNSEGATIDLDERLARFGFSADDLAVSATIWTIIEPEARLIADTHRAECRSGATPSGFGDSPDTIDFGTDYIRARFVTPNRQEWVRIAARGIEAAYRGGMPLTGILAMTSAGASVTLEILGRLYSCSKEERHRINDVFTRLRSLECDVYATLHTEHVIEEAKRQDRKSVV